MKTVCGFSITIDFELSHFHSTLPLPLHSPPPLPFFCMLKWSGLKVRRAATGSGWEEKKRALLRAGWGSEQVVVLYTTWLLWMINLVLVEGGGADKLA